MIVLVPAFVEVVRGFGRHLARNTHRVKTTCLRASEVTVSLSRTHPQAFAAPVRSIACQNRIVVRCVFGEKVFGGEGVAVVAPEMQRESMQYTPQ